MFKAFAIQWLKFFFAGEGLSVKTGRAIALAALTGVLSGLAASAFYFLLDAARFLLTENIAGVKPLLAEGEISLFAAPEKLVREPWLLLLLPAAGALISSLLVRIFSPESGGHGTDSCIFSFHHNDGIMPWRVIPVKAIASSIVIGSGGSAGCEGPMTQIGAACGSLLARIFRLSSAERRLLMVAGLSAGVGAMFRSPLAGAVFGAEILYSGLDAEYEVVMPSLVASTIAYSVFCLFFGWQSFFVMPEWRFDEPWQLLPFLALALFVSLGAKMYIFVFRKTERFFHNCAVPVWLRPAAGGFLTGVIACFLPEVMGAGYGIIQQALLVDTKLEVSVWTCSLFFLIFVFKILATSFTVGSGGSGGLFGPALVAGASLGAALGLFFERMLPMLDIHPGAYALVGMAGFLSASVRTPLAAIIMVSEISGNHVLLLPAMWVCGITYWLGNGWTIYRSQVRNHECSGAHRKAV